MQVARLVLDGFVSRLVEHGAALLSSGFEIGSPLEPIRTTNRTEPNPGSVHHGMPDWWANTLLKLEIVFLVIFSGKVIILLSVILNYLIIK